jgi:hypothetical protein
MFEKEAEEYVNEEYDFCYYPDDNLSTRINAERDWKNGAEFGFQKGIKAKINTTTISDCPIKDVWHYVTNWEDNSQFPTDEFETYLVRLYQDHYVVCELEITEGYRQFWLVDNLEPIDPQDVIAWKEIVPPDIKEE